ncbi:MAG: SusC/RagA family TonB-linked outer membrane protein [Bacteroidaceae bacterium]|nr:SusC/RagA family TonB-linked outer membrane protein [Bacteroidaceae bacterium]
MKRHILFGLTLLMACPTIVCAQDNQDAEQVVKAVKREVNKPKYETRVIKGKVVYAATGEPISGALVAANGIDGYSALTDDNGEYTVKVPTFASSIFITYPDCNSLLMGLAKGEEQKTAKMLTTDFAADYEKSLDPLAGKKADNFKYSNAINIKEEVENKLGAYAYSKQNNGTPGIGSTIFIQGLNSLNVNAQPLVVIDGVIFDQQYGRELLHDGFVNDILSNFNPADIEDVVVMRNGTALYGARGANGVIIIKTQRSKSMATRITASASVGVSLMPKFYDMMDAEQYRGYASELLKTTGTRINNFKFLNADPTYYYYKQYHNTTNWKDQVYRTAVTQNYGVKVEGGDDIAQYNLSVGYTRANSNLRYNHLNRLNIRFNTDIHLGKKFDIRFDASFSDLTRNIRDDAAPKGYDEGTPTAPSFLAYVKSPFMSPYSYGNGKISDSFLDINDETYLDEALSGYENYNYRLANPYALNEYAEAENKNRFENSILNLAITPSWKIVKNLVLSTHFSYSLVNTNNKYYIPINGVPSYYVSSVSAFRDNQVESLASRQNSIYSDTRLAWNNRYNAHSIGIFGGWRMSFESFTRSQQLGYNTGSDKTPFMSASLANPQAFGVDETWRNADAYLQANYNYAERYYAQVNLTASSSSRFGREASGGMKLFGVKWGIFPSIQATWVLTNESWFPKTNAVNNILITAGYDISGNDNIDVYAAKSFFGSSLYLNSIAGLTLSGVGNTNIKWETTARFNVGLEAKFFNNRLRAAFNFFSSKTSDLLTLQALHFLTGHESNWANSGKMKNTGYDITLVGRPVVLKDWSWEIGASVGHYKNQIESLGLGEGKTSFTTDIATATILTKEGEAANLFYGYRTKGVIASTEQAKELGLYVMDQNGVDKHYFGAGDVIFDDVDGNKEINDNDRVIIGDPNPDFYGNIFTALTWKHLRLDVNFNYSYGNDAFNYMRSQLEGGSRFLNQTTALSQRWQIENQQTDIPKITFQDPMGNSRFSDRWIEDASYIRLKSVTLSYNLPLKASFLQGLEFWVQGNNLFTLTKYLGTDPEFSSGASVIGQGIDYGSLASSRSIVAGIKIKL